MQDDFLHWSAEEAPAVLMDGEGDFSLWVDGVPYVETSESAPIDTPPPRRRASMTIYTKTRIIG